MFSVLITMLLINCYTYLLFLLVFNDMLMNGQAREQIINKNGNISDILF